MPVEDDYVRAILPEPPSASSEDRIVVMAAVLSDLDCPTVVFARRQRRSQSWPHRLVAVGVGALILAVFFIPLPSMSLFGRLEQGASSGTHNPTNGGSSSEETAKGFALSVLGEASTPPDARLTTHDVSGSLGRVFEIPGLGDLLDIHRFYLVDELVGTVESYVEVHLPKGAQVTSSTGMGTHRRERKWITRSRCRSPVRMSTLPGLPTTSNRSVRREKRPRSVSTHRLSGNRVDQPQSWLRPEAPCAAERHECLVRPCHGPTERRTSRQAQSSRKCPASWTPPSCMEDALLYRIVFRSTKGAPASFEADGWGRSAVVLVARTRTEYGPAF